MNEEYFWVSIDKASKDDEFYESLKEILCGMTLSEIISFENILQIKMTEAYVFPLLEANFVISSYVSDDGFKDFRAWLISRGRARFYAALNDVETIADWLDKDLVDQAEEDALRGIAEEAYILSGGEDSDFHRQIRYQPEPPMIQEWPENKADFRKKYPRLVEKYWNQQRIKDLHSG
jgi:hypothetical protein